MSSSRRNAPVGRALVVYKKHRLRADKKKQKRTICEVLREIGRSAEDRGDIFTLAKVDECYDMAKRMQYKLFEYQGDRSGYMVSILNPDGTYTIIEV